MKIQLKNQISRKLTTVPSSTPVGVAHRLMTNEWIRHLPITSEDGLSVVGLVSDRDLLGVRASTPVSKVMSPHVRTFEIDTPVIKIVRTMIEDKISSFLITKKNVVVGIVTSEDMLILLNQLLLKEEKNEWLLEKLSDPVAQNTMNMLSQAGI